MDGDFVFLLFENELEAKANRANVRIQNCQLRDASDPFHLPEPNFMLFFRLTRELARDLCIRFGPFLQTERSTAIPSTIKILSMLKSCVEWNLYPFVKFPTANQAKQHNKLQFYERFEFACVIGVIDCTHIAIAAPSAEDEEFPG
ncbi:hypothetical protein ILUMI_18108 [Ignelater luminosus]|uniref:Nuclease HARBI1 n=1 Tax=Ignelater luminosus TaxID=2038154 RepID=A0A8K0CKI2_IGNLU|nr:hypothetical protein ILUMI_18108 [Ignelater luminosus]